MEPRWYLPSSLALHCLLGIPVHVDDRGGDGDNHTQQGWQQAEAAAEFNLKNKQCCHLGCHLGSQGWLKSPDNFFCWMFWRRASPAAQCTSSAKKSVMVTQSTQQGFVRSKCPNLLNHEVGICQAKKITTKWPSWGKKSFQITRNWSTTDILACLGSLWRRLI